MKHRPLSATFQVADAAHAQSGPLGQLLLSQARGEAGAIEDRPAGGLLLGRGAPLVAVTRLTPSLARITPASRVVVRSRSITWVLRGFLPGVLSGGSRDWTSKHMDIEEVMDVRRHAIRQRNPERRSLMKHRPLVLATIALVLALVLSLVPGGVTRAAPMKIPSSLYPAGAHVTFDATLTNAQVDCLWNFFCDGGIPLYHSYSQEQLQRQSGWGEFAGFHRGHTIQNFELFASQYLAGLTPAGTPYSMLAFDDLVQTSRSYGYVRLSTQPRLLASGVPGGTIAEELHDGTSVLIIMAAWSGTQDVEAIALVDGGSKSVLQVTVNELEGQVRWAGELSGGSATRSASRQRIPGNDPTRHPRMAQDAALLTAASTMPATVQAAPLRVPAASPTVRFDWRLYESWTRAHHRPGLPMTQFSWPWMHHRGMCGGAVSVVILNPATWSLIQDFDRCWAGWSPFTNTLTFSHYANPGLLTGP